MEGYLLKKLTPEEMFKTLTESDKAAYKNVISHLLTAPFPIKEFSYLIYELSDTQRKQFLSGLNIRFRVFRNPEGIIQLVRTRLNKPNEKLKILQSLMMSVIDIYEEDIDLTDIEFLETEKDKVEKYGPWQFYWALRFFPDKSERIEKRIAELASELPAKTTNRPLLTSPSSETERKDDEKESQLVAHERSLRTKAELVIDGLNKNIRALEEHQKRLLQENQKLTEALREMEQQKEATLEKHEQERRKSMQLETNVLELKKEIKQMKAVAAEEQQQFTAALKEQSEQYEELHKKWMAAQTPTDAAEIVIKHLHDQSYALMKSLRQKAREDQASLRNEITNYLDLVNRIEHCLFPVPPATQTEIQEPSISAAPEAAAALETPDTIIQDIDVKKRTGTFYRKDFGGIIEFDNGETQYVKESIIHAVGLEHEAEIECRRMIRPDRTVYEHIEILFQGDDAYAPMDQYLGYVELGDHFTYYCVDIHNPENRYPIYEKDVEIQQPTDGNPCLFNVATNGTYARLSKLFNQEETNQHHVKQTIKRKEHKKQTATSTREPFLEGCKIAVIGGQAKWFEKVVQETGAEYVHENGIHPDRIFAELRKSNAIFKLYTATSHEAIWSSVEIAKANGIPHFMIEGSKSNLRNLLWENRELIRNGLPKKQSEQNN